MNRNKTMSSTLGTSLILLVALAVFGAGCATMEPRKPALVPTDRGTVVYFEKYEFQRPPEGWALMRDVEGGDFELGFLRMEKGEFPSQTTFMFDDKPYGSSRDLEKRADYYLRFFMFNSGMALRNPKRERLTINGRDALALVVEGENPITQEKLKSKIYLIKKGNRIISFVCTQWRPLNGTFSQEPFDHFETFVRSFQFLQKDFYEKLEEELKKLES